MRFPSYLFQKLCRDAENRTRIIRTRSVRNTIIPHPDTASEIPKHYSRLFYLCTAYKKEARPIGRALLF